MAISTQSAKSTSKSNKESSNSQQTRAENQSATIADKRPATLAQNRIMASMGSGSGVQRTTQLQAIMSGPAPIQRVKEDETQTKYGMEGLKDGMETLKDGIKNDRTGTLLGAGSIGVGTAKTALGGAATSAGAAVGGIGGGVLGGLTALKGGADVYRGRNKSKEAAATLAKTNQTLDNDDITNERVNARIAQQEGKDQMRDGTYGMVSGGLSTAAGVLTATGVGAPVALGLGIAGAAVSGVGALHGMAEQSGRDKEARRMRSKDEIIADKTTKNKERADRIDKGSIFNPLNWKAKAERATGWGDGADKQLGLGDTGDAHALDKYAESKRGNYKKEGYGYNGFDGKDKKDQKITKKTKKGGSWNPLHWGEGATEEETTLNREDIQYNKAMASKEVDKRQKKKNDEKGWFGW